MLSKSNNVFNLATFAEIVLNNANMNTAKCVKMSHLTHINKKGNHHIQAAYIQ